MLGWHISRWWCIPFFFHTQRGKRRVAPASVFQCHLLGWDKPLQVQWLVADAERKKIYQNMWFCASAPVCFDNNGGLLFWLGVPTSVSTHQSTWQRLQRLTRLTAGTVVTPRGRERHQHGYCGAGVTQHQRCGRFVFANTRHTAPHARHRAKRGVLCA